MISILEMGREQLVNVSKFLVHHESKNTHLGRTSLVQFNGTLLHLLGISQLVPSKVKSTITEVSLELSGAITKCILVHAPRSGVLILVGGLHHGPCGDQLSPNHTRKVVQGGESGWNVLGAWETNSSVGDEVSDDGKHGNASVLELNPTKTIELLLVAIGNISECINETEGGLGAKFLGEIGVECSAGGLCDGGRGEGGGRTGEGSEDGKLHHCVVLVDL
mmetsp:Transcript_12199/g.26569  ORF Transcript_12199/g.26569 Transcript_12199/m.26569 type:complete len:220 (-) Transcript_12199:34-693(-)